MQILTNERPSIGFVIGMLLAVACSAALLAFIFVSGIVTLVEVSLTTMGVGSLLYYFSIPIIAKRRSYIGSEPKPQLASIRIVPFVAFVITCLSFAGYL